jgi:hypothetical protein
VKPARAATKTRPTIAIKRRLIQRSMSASLG